MRTIGFIGAGTVGSALAISLQRQGYTIAGVTSRSRESAQRLASLLPGVQACESPQEIADTAELVFLTVPDDYIKPVTDSLRWQPGRAVVHCSGSLSLDALQSARLQGASTGGIHPLQTFASVENAIQNLPGSTFALESDAPALLEELRAIAAALGGHSITLGKGDKALYHASAVLACNYLVTLVKLATDLWLEMGISRADATRALLPLLEGTVSNIEKVGLPGCLTGPIARGDAGTIEKHLIVLRSRVPELVDLYKALGRHTIPIALEKGKLSPLAAARLQGLLDSDDEEESGERNLAAAG